MVTLHGGDVAVLTFRCPACGEIWEAQGLVVSDGRVRFEGVDPLCPRCGTQAEIVDIAVCDDAEVEECD